MWIGASTLLGSTMDGGMRLKGFLSSLDDPKRHPKLSWSTAYLLSPKKVVNEHATSLELVTMLVSM
jgi:hypothetical protein